MQGVHPVHQPDGEWVAADHTGLLAVQEAADMAAPRGGRQRFPMAVLYIDDGHVLTSLLKKSSVTHTAQRAAVIWAEALTPKLDAARHGPELQT